MRNIILLNGKSGVGKSTITHELVRMFGVKRISFATPLKEMLITLGLTDAQVYGDQKNEPCDVLCGKTPRWAMQTLGTEWGRDLIHSDLWIKAWQRQVLATDGGIVTDDCRFQNEIDAAREIGNATVFNLKRTDFIADGMVTAHASEHNQLTVDYYLGFNSSVPPKENAALIYTMACGDTQELDKLTTFIRNAY